MYFQSDDEIDDNEDDVDDVDTVKEEEEKEDQDDISSHMFAFPIRCCWYSICKAWRRTIPAR